MEIRLSDMLGCQEESASVYSSHSTELIDVYYGHYQGSTGGRWSMAIVFFKKLGIRLVGGSVFRSEIAESEDRFQTAWKCLLHNLNHEHLAQLLYEHGMQEYRLGQENKLRAIKDVLEIKD